MKWFKSFYSFLEKRFFNSLTRKLSGNLFFLLLLQIGEIALLLHDISHLQRIAAAAGGDIARQAALAGEAAWRHALFIVLLSLGGFASILFFLRYLVVRPVRYLTGLLQKLSGSDGDLS